MSSKETDQNIDVMWSAALPFQVANQTVKQEIKLCLSNDFKGTDFNWC